MPDYKTISMGDDQRFIPGGGVETLVTSSIMVGDLGPFRVSVKKTDNWAADLRSACQKVVNDVNQAKG